jgi:DNA adenine methylase
MVYEAEVTLDEHARQREIYEAGDWSDPLRLGFAAFFLNRTNRSGIIRGSGVIGGKKQDGNYKIDCRFTKDELVRRIRRIALYRQRIHLSRMDAIDFMHVKALTLPSSAFFCIDPPYFEKGAKLYTNSFTRDDHTRVAGAIQRLRQPYIVTYDDAPTIANLFSLRRRFRLNLPYSLQVKRVGTELVILSDRLRICDVGEGISKVSLMAYEGAIA